MEPRPVAYPPETLEGWYALHQIFRIDRERERMAGPIESAIFRPTETSATDGWSEAVALIGSTSDVMFVHFRRTLDELGDLQRELAREPWMRTLIPTYSFLSVTEAGLYHITAKLAQSAAERGGSVGDAEYQAAAKERAAKERENAFVQRRLYPQRPEAMPYVCFYPMSKRRAYGQNWYAQTIEDRSRMMHEHGLTGRRYAGKVLQIITGAIGFDAWEWGVTLFAADPLEFKKLVSEMRFDEASAEYADFGAFYVGRGTTLEAAVAG